MRRILRTVLMASLVVIVGGCRTPAPGSQPDLPSGVEAGWPAYGATAGGTHFSHATQVTPANVHKLELAWTHRSGDYREADLEADFFFSQSSLQVTPILANGTLFYCTPFNRVFALDPESGEEKWMFDPGVDMDREPILPNCRGVSSWRSGRKGVCEHRIVMGTLDARLVVLDAETGKPCEDFGVGGEVDTSDGLSAHDPMDYGITSPPAILGDRIITGSMVLDNQRTDSPGGVVRAYHVRTGELLWAWNPIPPGMPARDEAGYWRSGTTNVWSIISVDTERELVFLPTGNTTPDHFGGHRGGLDRGTDHYSSSLVALHGDTGEVAWHQQLVHHDIWDYDTPAQPTLVDLPIDGQIVPAVVQVTKMGMSFAFHRETGVPLWPVEERPVPGGAVPEEYLSPTQPFPTHIPYTVDPKLGPEDAWGLLYFDKQACADKLASLNNEGIYTPPSTNGTLQYPVNAGGNNWGSPALDPRSGVMVVATTRVPGEVRLVPRSECAGNLQQQAGTPYCVETGFVMSPLGVPCTEPPWGTLDAIDIVAGKRLWSVPLGTSRDLAPFPFWWIKGLPGFGGPMLTATGLVFSGVSNEHAFRAFSLDSGEELWKVRLPTAANAVPMTYQLREGGRQFVVVAAGGHWSGGAPPGDYLLAYALPMTQGE